MKELKKGYRPYNLQVLTDAKKDRPIGPWYKRDFEKPPRGWEPREELPITSGYLWRGMIPIENFEIIENEYFF